MKQQIALVTGANRGIGYEICKQLASKGITIILTARDTDKGEAASQTLIRKGYDIHFHPLDITDSGQIQKLVDYIKSTFNRLDILVNNAGIYLDYLTPALDINANTILRAVETDVCGTFSMSQAAIPLMKKNNYGRIVNLSSTSSLIANMKDDTGLAYKICKTAINAITVVLSNAVADDNILINSVTPGWVRRL
ncbi:MAG: short-chain dehydrogenase/reductase SDR [Candidatus Magnetoglobus multicellularis str. Araruama]|uniref:Short-chain dehydrogenase/reductase SDR n=1 Tax=Candidatus Magnetoglobus multicellularis str. Araruama TaxID=890399 RepID=A0A1V1NTC8_9BACT|nr:MAG: short-chain dehydrogenase/reductase SDR [Candidatus Magnetoglobus multicellularis str. Araruama]